VRLGLDTMPFSRLLQPVTKLPFRVTFCATFDIFLEREIARGSQCRAGEGIMSEQPSHYQGQQHYYSDHTRYQGQHYGQQARPSGRNKMTSISPRLGRRRVVDGFSCRIVGSQL